MLSGSTVHHSAPGSPGANDLDSLPRSVRGASPELRRLIRKKQNADSARRCRLKLRLEREREAERAASPALSERVDQLTRLVNEMQARLVATELSCAALLERALANQPHSAPPGPMPYLPAAYVAQAQHPVSSADLQPPASMPVSPVAAPSNNIAMPDDAHSDNECSSPSSPIAINYQAYFDTPFAPFKQTPELFDEESESDMGDSFASSPELPFLPVRL